MLKLFKTLSIPLLGLVAIRIWLQVCIYDRYTSTDFGTITVASNIIRVLVIAIGITLITRFNFKPHFNKVLGPLSIALMTASAALFLLNNYLPSQALTWLACLCAGIGIAWGGGMWISVYEKLRATDAFIYTFVSLAISCIVGFILALLPIDIVYLMAMLMPATAYILFQQAKHDLKLSDIDFEQKKGHTYAYDLEQKRSIALLLAGIALFNLALGLSRGYPDGVSIELTTPFQAFHQFATAGLCVACIYLTHVKKHPISYAKLWTVSITCIVSGVLLFSLTLPITDQLAGSLISIANTFSLAILWYLSFDISKNSSKPAYLVLGIIWITHLLPREIGRAAIWAIHPHSISYIVLSVFIILTLALSLVYLLNTKIFKTRTLFSDLNEELKIDTEASPALFVQYNDAIFEYLKQRYNLTEREVDITRLYSSGRTKSIIAQELGISENTVRSYTKNLYSKLSINSKQELINLIEQQVK